MSDLSPGPAPVATAPPGPHRGPHREVLLVVPDYLPTTGGTTFLTAAVARTLSERGMPVSILTRRRHPDWPAEEVVDGVRVRRVGPAGRSDWGEKLALAALCRTMGRRVDSPVQFVMYPEAAFAAVLAGRVRRAACTWGALGEASRFLGPRPGTARDGLVRLRRRLLRRLDHVALTREMADELAPLLGEPVIIGSPVDTELFRPPSTDERAAARSSLGLSSSDFVAVYTGHLRALKRVDRLVEAVAGLDGTQLLLVGGSRGATDDREIELREQVQRLGLGARVHFAGVISDRREVRRHLWAADSFVLASEQEGMPLSLIEAMACGLACVAPPSAGGAFLEGAGAVPGSGEVPELVAALTRLRDDPGWRERLGAEARRRVESLSREKITDAYEELWSRLGRAEARGSR